jgi:hypothetical protein
MRLIDKKGKTETQPPGEFPSYSAKKSALALLTTFFTKISTILIEMTFKIIDYYLLQPFFYLIRLI